jgi:hypothetical protein
LGVCFRHSSPNAPSVIVCVFGQRSRTACNQYVRS